MLKKKRKVGRPSKKELQREKNIKFILASLIILIIGILFYNVKNYIKDNSNKVQASVNYTCPSGYEFVDYLFTKKNGEYQNINNRCIIKTDTIQSEKLCEKGTPQTFCYRGNDNKLHKYTCKKGYYLAHTSKYGVKCYKGKKATVDSSTLTYSIKDAEVSEINDYYYTGKKIKPSPTVSLNGSTLTKGKDYKLQYSNNKKIGTAKIKIVGLGKYKDSIIVEFKIISEVEKNKPFEDQKSNNTTDTIQPSNNTTQPTTNNTTTTTTTPGKVKIRIDVNGGKVNTNKYGYTQSGSLVLQNGKDVIDSAKYGSTLGKYGLTDPNSKTKLNITRKGYKIVNGKEYKCKSGCIKKGRIYNEETQYKASDFCDASKGNCTVTLEVNWKKK